VRTSDGSQSFAVVADPGNAAWNASQNGFAIPAGVAAQTVPVVAAMPGAAGNVLAGTVTLIAAALPGVDVVDNAGPMQGGEDAESDAAFRLRFQGFIDSRTRATRVAVAYAIGSVQQGLQFTIAENQAADGTVRMGLFTVTVDDGTGNPSATLLSTVATAIEAVRPLGSTFSVLAPSVVAVQISMSVTSVATTVHATVIANVISAVTAYVNALSIGAPLPWSRLAQVAYDADPGVTNVTGVLVNGGMSDIVPSATGVVKATLVQVI
jgi:uncharacterized phage protein gp47/JayE